MSPEIIAVLSTIVTGVGIAFRYMWTKMIARHEECEKDRKEIWNFANVQKDEMALVKRDLAVFSGCQNDNCGARESIKRMREYKTVETFSVARMEQANTKPQIPPKP